MWVGNACERCHKSTQKVKVERTKPNTHKAPEFVPGMVYSGSAFDSVIVIKKEE